VQASKGSSRLPRPSAAKELLTPSIMTTEELRLSDDKSTREYLERQVVCVDVGDMLYIVFPR
jgi:hypothetical protein